MPGNEKIVQDPETEKLGLEVRARISRGRLKMLAGAPSFRFERRQHSITDLPLSGHMTCASIKAFYQQVPYNFFLCEMGSSSG